MSTTLKRGSWLKDTLAALTAVSGIGYLATAYTISRWLTRASRHQCSLPESTAAVRWENLDCTTRDGLLLRGWVATPAHPRATIALFHGLRGNRGRTMSRIAFLTEAGYRCVAFDHRAHGQSAGRLTSFGYREAQDVLAVLDLIDRLWPHQPRAALGMSMGAAAVCYAAPRSGQFDALVLESVYHDLASAFQARVGTHFPLWFGRFRRGVIWLTEKRLRLRLAEMAPIRFIGELRPAPILLLTGEHDSYATPAEVADLFRACRSPSELHILAGAGHENLWDHGGDNYRAVILDFLRRQLFRHADARGPLKRRVA